MLKFGILLLIHGIVIPTGILMSVAHFPTSNTWMFIAPPAAALWIVIFGRIYVKKINKLKQEIDTGE